VKLSIDHEIKALWGKGFFVDAFGNVVVDETIPSQVAHVAISSERRGRCNEQVPSESGNAPTSARPERDDVL
jgi:hypothetical protein